MSHIVYAIGCSLSISRRLIVPGADQINSVDLVLPLVMDFPGEDMAARPAAGTHNTQYQDGRPANPVDSDTPPIPSTFSSAGQIDDNCKAH